MKTQSYAFLSVLSIFFGFSSCKKAPPRTIFKSTTYQTLGSYNSVGLPNYLTAKDSISPGMLSYVDSVLIDGRNLTVSHPELFAVKTDADIIVTAQSDVYVTFVFQNSTLTNSIGFYTYPTIQPPTTTDDIKTITYVFPNAGIFTPLVAGDKVKIGSFTAGTSIGFVLLKKGWNSDQHKLDINTVHFCTSDILNPETDSTLKRHAVLIDYAPENKKLIGFEDSDRSQAGCDNDFNDVVFYCNVVP
jgi:Domain of unknown function (DUF4114)